MKKWIKITFIGILGILGILAIGVPYSAEFKDACYGCRQQ